MFDKISDTLQKYLMPIANKISSNNILQSIKDAFLISLPFTMLGSIFLALVNLPFLNDLIGADAVASLQAFQAPLQNVCFNLITIIIVFGIGYSLGKRYELKPAFTAATAFICFMIVTPIITIKDTNYYIIGNFGQTSIFTGLIIAVVSTLIYRTVIRKNWVIRMPESVPEMVTDSFNSLIPACISVLFFFIIMVIMSKTSYGTLNALIYAFVQTPITALAGNLVSFIFAGLLCNLFWFFGLHGNNLVYNSVLSPIFKSLSLQNLAAFNAGKAIPNLLSEEFAFYFGGFNGSFIAYPVLICIFVFFRKRKELKELGKVALIPGIFSIYEPLVFGMPLMLNPIYLIPMLLTPVIDTLIAVAFMATGLCGYCTGVSVPWTCPMIISGMITTNSIMGGVVQLVQIVVTTALWYVFMKVAIKAEDQKKQDLVTEGDNSNE